MKNYGKDTEPLRLLLSKYHFDISRIDQIASGQKYTAIMLKNGNIGVCANLGNSVLPEPKNYLNPDLRNNSHRIILTAYFNALLNYTDFTNEGADIFDVINFKKYRNPMMIGYFQPLVKKFKSAGISINIFDLHREGKKITPAIEQKNYLSRADAVILTSTSVFNQTFIDTIHSTSNHCSVFLLGPSSIMTKEMFNYKNIQKIFGTTFLNSDERILKIIKNNGGTKDFLKYGNKRIFENTLN